VSSPPGDRLDLRYGVAWRAPDGREARGSLVLDGAELVLRGSGSEGSLERVHVPLTQVGGVRIGRSEEDRIRGERSVVIELRDGGTISIAPIGAAGAVFELADLVVELGAQAAGRDTAPVVVVLPLRAGAAARARELVADGPPFDLDQADLDRHIVFVTESEVVFLFEGERARETLDRLLRRPRVLREAARWRDVLAGRPRLGEESYSWRRNSR
jgi:hypothetical protein